MNISTTTTSKTHSKCNFYYLLQQSFKNYNAILIYLLLTPSSSSFVSSYDNDHYEWRNDKYTMQYKQNDIIIPADENKRSTTTSSRGKKYDLHEKLGLHFPWLKKFNSNIIYNNNNNDSSTMGIRKDVSSSSSSNSISSSRRQTLYHVASWHHRNQTTEDDNNDNDTCPTNNNHSKNKENNQSNNNNHKKEQESTQKQQSNTKNNNKSSFQNYFPRMSKTQKKRNLSTLKSMFTHGYDSYIRLAFPSSELKPLSCVKGKFDLARIPCLTLIDTLDTLLILGNYTEFSNAIELLKDYHYDMSRITSRDSRNSRRKSSFSSSSGGGIFDLDENVSLFETNIRVLGGLLSAHQLIVYIQETKKQKILHKDGTNWIYDGFLLLLAKDIGDRFLPAFETDTGIPYGTVNLKYGVPIGETTIASLAGGGTLSIEMELLSRLTGDRRYGDAAILATRALFINKSRHTSLVGKHIDINTGSWRESLSGIGSNSDSFYEYLLKFYALFNEQDFYAMFVEVYMAIQAFLKTDDDHWYTDVDMSYGGSSTSSTSGRGKMIIESLSAFWPGMQVMLGDLTSAKKMLNALFMIREEWGFLPERFDFGNWNLDGIYDEDGIYRLRPELFESTYFMHRASRSDSWLWAADFSVHALEHLTKTECGYATIRTASSRVQFDEEQQWDEDSSSNNNKNRGASSSSSNSNNDNKDNKGWNGYFNKNNIELEDEMPSYFLAETIKYLYLMFDDDNILHDENDIIQWVFTTEAHPVHYVEDKSRPKQNDNDRKYSGKWTTKTTARRYWDQIRSVERKLQKERESSSSNTSAQQCCMNNHHPSVAWKHALAFDGGVEYEVGYGTKLHAFSHHRNGANEEQLPVQDGLCRVIPYDTMSSSSSDQQQNNMNINSVNMSRKSSSTVYVNNEEFQKHLETIVKNEEQGKSKSTTLSDNSIVEVVTTNSGFFAKNDVTGESIEAALIDSISSKDSSKNNFSASLVLVITVQKVNDEADPHWTVLVADWNNNIFRCTVQMDIAGKMLRYPCSTAMFGATEMSKLISRNNDKPLKVSGEVVLPIDPTNPFGCSKPVRPNTEKIILVRRGECSFERKIRNYESAKAVIMLNNEPNHLFVMASSSPIEDLKDFETLSVLITEEDGRKLIESANNIRTYGTHTPEYDKDGMLISVDDNVNKKIVATIIVERQRSLTNNEHSDDSSSSEMDGNENVVSNDTESDSKISDTTTITNDDYHSVELEKENDFQTKINDDTATTTETTTNDIPNNEKENDENNFTIDPSYRWPLISTAPNLLHVLVQRNWGIQAYFQKSINNAKEDQWSLFILQHNGMESSKP